MKGGCGATTCSSSAGGGGDRGGPCLLPHVSKSPRTMTTRSATRAVEAGVRAEVFERIVGPVIASGYLRWYEVLQLGKVSKGTCAAWREQQDSYEGWEDLLGELNTLNCTNRCSSCEQIILLKSSRACCPSERWTEVCAERKPNFHGVLDILMSSGYLTWREKGGVRRISKASYKVHKMQCTCLPHDRTTLVCPFLPYEPRYKSGYDSWSPYRKCKELSTYTAWMVKNLHSFYDLTASGVTNPDALPYGLGGWAWFDLQMVTLQRTCPRRYSLVMNMVSLFLAQGELQRSPQYWYASAFLGRRHDPVTGASYEECLGSGITEFCLPATDDVLCRFLRNKCYPSQETQEIVGPLVHKISIFSPFFSMVPLDANKRPRMHRGLEVLDDEMIDSMSFHFFCTIS
jgi:hypothetical protein